jgi:hypothetical protein
VAAVTGLVWLAIGVGGLLAGAALHRIAHRARVFDDLPAYDLQRRWRELYDQDADDE